MPELNVGDTVEFTVEAEVVARYDNGKLKLRWHSGEVFIFPSDTRLNNEA
jgi:hypothetical protein